MKRLPRVFIALLTLALIDCAHEPPSKQPQPATEPIVTQAATSVPAPSVATADALLADMARREAAFKEFERTLPPPPPPPRLEDFIPRAPQTETRAEMISAGAPPSQEPSMALSSPAAPQSEEHWKNRMRDAQARLDAAELAQAAASAQVREVERYVRPDGKMSPVIADNLLRAQESETRAVAGVVFARTQMANLHEEARRAGIPPGWLRP